MAVAMQLRGHFHWIYLLIGVVFLRNGTGYRMAFFRFADRDMPRFWLTKDEIEKAIKMDDTWANEATEMQLLGQLKYFEKEIPEQGGTKGLSVEAFNMIMNLRESTMV